MANRSEGNPGETDQRLHDLIAEFHEKANRGEAVDRTQFVAQHPEFREELNQYFDQVATNTNPNPAEGTVVAAGSRSGNFDETMIEGSHAGDHARLSKDAPRTQFGRYRILNELGRGAMGAVYLAHDEQLDREIALKIPQFGQDLNPDLLERFYREARAAAALRHPGICPVYDVGEIDGQHYITMAFIKGRPLRDFTKTTKTQGVRQIIRVIRKLAIALEVAHRHKVVHRDLKPANVMIDESKEPVVMDFGLARRTAEKEEKLTHSGTVIGTPAYMSPEQVDGDNDRVGPPADIYSLGVIFYELLTGQLPFQGSLMSILKQIATVDPKPPSEFRNDLPREVEAICQKMMAKQIEDRYQTMDQVSAALTDILKDQKASTEESGTLEATKAPVRQRKNVEATDTMTMPGKSRQKPLDEEFAEETFQYEPVSSRRRSRSAKQKSVRAKTDQRKMLIAGGVGGALLLSVIAFFLIPGRNDVTTTVDAPAEEAAWQELFNGSELTGWKALGHDGWAVDNGILTGETTSQQGCLMSDSEYGNFELELEYFLTSGSNSGVFLRAWPDGPVNGREFDEIQLLDDTAANHASLKDTQSTGALFGHVAPSPVLRPKPNEWHLLRIRAVEQQVNVWINGSEVLATSLSKGKRSRGHIGLQLYPKKVQFRNIRVREIGATVADNNAAIDLIALLKPERDFMRPEIQLKDGILRTPRAGYGDASALVMIPQPVPEEYDVDIQLERVSEVGMGLSFGIVMGGQQGVVCMDGTKSATWCLENIDGQSIKSTTNPTVNLGKRLEVNKVANVSIRVRTNRVTTLLDGETIFDWTGHPDQLSIWSAIKMTNKESLFFFSQAEFDIHRMTLTPRTTITSARKSASLSTIELLPLVDISRDAGVGNWNRVADGVACENPAGANVLQLPYEPPDEYDFEIEFTTTGSGLNVNQYVAAGGTMFAWKLNSHNVNPPLYGFELLDGKFAKENKEAAKQIPDAIKDGQRYRSTVEVRRGSLRTLLDGKELVKWTGDFKRLSIENSTPMKYSGRIGIGSWRRPVTFHAVRVREVGGAGKLYATTR